MADKIKYYGEKRISDSIKANFEKSPLSQKQISEKSKVAESSISGYLKGSTLPGLYVAIKLADALGVTLDEFTGHSKKAINNLHELLSAIYKINDVLPLKYENGTLSFDNPTVHRYLTAWESIKSLQLPEDQIDQIMQGWEKRIEEETEKIIISEPYNYRSIEDWSDELIDDFKTYLRPQLNSVVSVEGYPNVRSAYYPNWRKIHPDVPEEVFKMVCEKMDITVLNDTEMDSQEQ